MSENWRSQARMVLQRRGILEAWVVAPIVDDTELIVLLSPKDYESIDVEETTGDLMHAVPHTKVWVIAKAPDWTVEDL